MLRDKAYPLRSTGEQIQDDRQVDKGIADSDIGDIRHPGLVWARYGEVLSKIRVDPMRVIAVRSSNPAPLVLSDKSTLSHDAQYLFMVDRLAATVKLLGHPAVAVAGEFNDDGLNLSDQIIVIPGGVLWFVVIRAARQIHDSAPPFGALDEVTMLSNELSLFFGGDKRPL